MKWISTFIFLDSFAENNESQYSFCVFLSFYQLGLVPYIRIQDSAKISYSVPTIYS